MRHLLILAAAASLAMGCHSRTEDEVGGATPEQDTTAVAADTAQAAPTDTTMGQTPAETDTSFVQQDTTMADPGMGADTTAAGADSVGAQGEVQTGDTTGAWTDTTGAAAPADSATPLEGGTPADTVSQPNQ